MSNIRSITSLRIIVGDSANNDDDNFNAKLWQLRFVQLSIDDNFLSITTFNRSELRENFLDIKVYLDIMPWQLRYVHFIIHHNFENIRWRYRK